MDLYSPPSTSLASGAAVAVETVLLGVHAGRLTYRTAQQDLLGDDHPDGLARRLAGIAEPRGPGDRPDGRMLHSTSWRFAARRIVLTYAALPDPRPATATVLGPPGPLAIGSDPLSPSPPAVASADVVAHACRHLAFLHHTDPVVAAASRLHPDLWRLLDAYRPGVAGTI